MVRTLNIPINFFFSLFPLKLNNAVYKPDQQVTLRGQRKRTLNNRVLNPIIHKNLHYLKERLLYFSYLKIFKTKKTVAKYIAPIPAGLIQHRIIAGSCRQLRVLFIANRTFLSCQLIIIY